MKNLKPYQKCSKQAYDDSITSKHRENRIKLRRIRGQVFTKYDGYAGDVPSMKQIPLDTISRANKNILISAYESKTKEFQEILDEIRSIQESSYLRQYCQYCGVNLSKSNDHYFPKEDYSYYAIFPINIIPCCIDCNGKKGTRIYRPTGERKFINFYYDNLEGKCFLECSIVYEDHIPVFTFGLEFDPAFDPNLKIIVEEHYSNLGLIEKYKNISETDFELISDEFSESSLERTEVLEMLTRKLGSFERQLGYNHFKTALLRSIISGIDDYLDFLRQKFI